MNNSDRRPGALDGIRIVEVSSTVSAAYCGKLLADLGAEVIKVEPPRTGDALRGIGPFLDDEADPDRGLLFNFLNTNKLGVTLELSRPTGRDWLLRLLADTDVFLFSGLVSEIGALRLGMDALHTLHAGLVGVYVTPFGLTGPYAEFRGGELVAFQMSALGCLTPGGAGNSADSPPLKAGGYQAQMVAGVTAATATMHALFAREADQGRGRPVDVSEHEAIASFQFMNMARWVYSGDRVRRPRPSPGYRIRCKDGQVAVMFSQDHQWAAWVEVMGHPAWAEEERFATRQGRARHAAELVESVEGWATAHTAGELYRAGQAHRVPIFPLNTVADAVESDQVRSRGFLQEMPTSAGATVLAPSAPYQWSETPPRVRRAAPRLGQHNREVLCGRLGLSDQELTLAYEAGVL